MESKASLLLDLSKNDLLNDQNLNDKQLNDKHLTELNSNHNDLTKLLINKINSLNRPKSRSGSINELLPPYSPTKCLNELNFYKTTEFDYQSSDKPNESDELKASSRKGSIKSDNQINKLLQIKQIKQLNDLLFLNNTIYDKMSINLQDQFELESLTSSEPNREWSLDDKVFVLQCLNRHNYLRKQHNVPNLNLSKNLINYSKDWVDIIARNDRLEKRFSNRYGENVFVMQLDEDSTSLNGAIPVDHWYNKGKNYDYTQENPKFSTREFTQIIWKSTKYLGVACARSKKNKLYVVASYNQSGNFPNMYLDNVLKPKI